MGQHVKPIFTLILYLTNIKFILEILLVFLLCFAGATKLKLAVEYSIDPQEESKYNPRGNERAAPLFYYLSPPNER